MGRSVQEQDAQMKMCDFMPALGLKSPFFLSQAGKISAPLLI